MLKIGDFSKTAKVTVKVLRYYESNQLLELSRIIYLK